jgi:hypothetical protein
MAGLVPAIHVFDPSTKKSWMPGTRPGMTRQNYPECNAGPCGG